MKNRHRFARFNPMVLVAVAGLTSCVAVEVQPDADNKGGSIILNPNGAEDFVRARRKDAKDRMDDFCGKDNYVITKDETRARKQNEGTGTLQGTLAVLNADEVVHIAFRCKK